MGLDSVELVIDVEKEFDVDIPDADLLKIETIGDFHDYLVAHVVGGRERQREIWDRLCKIVATYAPRTAVLDRDTGIVKDLGID